MNDTPFTLVARRVHAIVDREVAADEVSTHGRVLTRERIRLVHCVGLVLAMIDPYCTAVPCRRLVEFVPGFRPVTPAAKS